MARQILLLFLSDVKVDTGNPKKISAWEYKGVGLAETTNESSVRFLLGSDAAAPVKLDRIFLFASKKVRGPIYINAKKKQVYQDAAGRSWTHLAYFYKRLRDVLPDIEAISEVIPFDEDMSAADSMGMVLDAAARIQRYIAALPPEEPVVLHADCTGGMRYATMMMLDVMRLTEYFRVKVGRVFYSDYGKKIVDSMDSIYRAFNMTAGAEEFVRFGSVQVLWDYFHVPERPLSAGLERLLQAMRQFAAEIRMCRYGAFTAAIRALRDAVQSFSSGESVDDKLMGTLLARIQQDYGSLFRSEELDDLQLIHWCLEHDYLQQALTLYTERVPEYLGEQGLVQVTEAYRERMCRGKQGDKREETFYLLTAYDPINDVEDKAAKKELKAEADAWKSAHTACLEEKRQSLLAFYRDTVLAIAKGRYNMDDLPRDLDALFAGTYFGLQQRKAALAMLRRLAEVRPPACRPLKDIAPQDQVLQHLVQVYKEERGGSLDGKKFDQQFGKQKYQELVNFIQKNMGERAMARLFSDVSGYAEHLQWLLQKGIVVCSPRAPQREIFDIMNRYGVIKDERNHSNHAKMECGELSADELKEYMEDGLAELQAAARG